MNVLITIGLWILVFAVMTIIELCGCFETNPFIMNVGGRLYENTVSQRSLPKMLIIMGLFIICSGAWFGVEILGLNLIKGIGFGVFCIIGIIVINLIILALGTWFDKLKYIALVLFLAMPNGTAATFIIICAHSVGWI